jgi:hypothetical protein
MRGKIRPFIGNSFLDSEKFRIILYIYRIRYNLLLGYNAAPVK